ncbi:MAG: hypothetical protein KBC30_01805 [Planctomycetes bacterium]|jgi:hypothetical protein|nr:hypothetical protein [Planctomycetota bacterium]HNZ66554.1 hypothetical protein [Planctomycetota bacterium]HPY74344.1 hypothetical protein [Planctomycetota bacterium]HQA99890.1 hypothetical protein [Planctomycetota bacterium]
MKYIIWIVFFFFTTLYSQETKQWIKIQNVQLQKQEFPWGEEVNLNIQGVAHPQLSLGTITIYVDYDKSLVEFFHTQIPAAKENICLFSFSNDSIFNPVSEVLSGEYTIRIEFKLEEQTSVMQDTLRPILKKSMIQSYSSPPFFLGTKKSRQQQISVMRNFYVERIRIFAETLQELMIQRRHALLFGMQKDIKNPYNKNNRFDFMKWIKICQEMTDTLNQQELMLKKYEIRYTHLLFSNTHHSLVVYNQELLSMVDMYCSLIDQFYRKTEMKFFQDPFGYISMYENFKRWENIHKKIERELLINLESRLGYFPPGPIMNYFR